MINEILEAKTSELTSEQEKFVSKLSFSALFFGPIFYWTNGFVVRGFLFLIPFYNIYLSIHGFIKGRRFAWEKGEWKDFNSYEKRQRILGKVTLGLFIFIIILSSTVSFSLYLSFKEPSRVAFEFVNGLVSGDIQRAYDGASKDLRDVGSLEEFREYVESNGIVGGNSIKFNNWEMSDNNAVITGSFINKNRVSQDIELILEKESGVWRVEGVSLEQK